MELSRALAVPVCCPQSITLLFCLPNKEKRDGLPLSDWSAKKYFSWQLCMSPFLDFYGKLGRAAKKLHPHVYYIR